MKRKVQKYLASRGYADTPGDDHRFDLHGEVEECLEAAEKSKHAVMMAEERLQREKAKPQRQLAEIKYWQGYIKVAEESIAAGQLARESYLDRLKHDVPRLVGGSLPRHPLKKVDSTFPAENQH